MSASLLLLHILLHPYTTLILLFYVKYATLLRFCTLIYTVKHEHDGSDTGKAGFVHVYSNVLYEIRRIAAEGLRTGSCTSMNMEDD